MRKCLTCKFFKRDQNLSFGDCNRYPPKLFFTHLINDDPHQPNIIQSVPVVNNEHVCGEWEGRGS